MQSLGHFPVQLFRRLVARIRAWKSHRQPATPFVGSLFPNVSSFMPPIHREVSANGVRVYSLCCDCGAQLQASATLCDECAQKRSRPARPF